MKRELIHEVEQTGYIHRPLPVHFERRFELAFEGVRFYDLLRWHDADRVLNENQKDIVIYRSRTETVTKTITYRPETNGFLQIPLSEIELSKGVLTANPGWGSEAAYQDIY